jgi:DNA-binding NtrC family response regulator
VDKNILAISNDPDSRWLQALKSALEGSGSLKVASEREAWVLFGSQDSLIILDATSITGGLPALLEHLCLKWPDVPVVVATTSPTWQRARQAFRAGASDYIRKSLDRKAILASLDHVLAK